MTGVAPSRQASLIRPALALLFCAVSAAPLTAQSIIDGQRVEFLPSADNDTIVAGVALVQGYALNIYAAGSGTVVSTADLGKPTPDADGYMRVAYVPRLTTPLQFGAVYESRVLATGPGGSTPSEVSNTFTLTVLCSTATIAPGSVDLGPGAATGTVTVASTCGWGSISSAPWITITSGATGTANGSLGFSVSANTFASPRSGTMTIAGNTFTVNQAAACGYSLTSTNQSVPAAGGAGSVTVTTGVGCPWTATSNAGWITVTSGGSGAGSGSIGFSADGNTGATTRSGTVTIGAQTFTVNEAACAYTVSPATLNVGYTVTSGSVTVTTSPGCGWTATKSATWVTLGSGGTGSGTVSYSFAANLLGPPRTTNVTIAGQQVAVTQGGTAPPALPTNLKIIR